VIEVIVIVIAAGVVVESVYWAMTRGAPLKAVGKRWAYTLGIAKSPLPPLIEIPAGFFRMGSEGSAEEGPVHRVTFAQPFYIGRTEVTFAEWDACVSDGGCYYYPDDYKWGREGLPVINVHWEDAQAYVEWLNRKGARTVACRARRSGNTPLAPELPPNMPCHPLTAAMTSKGKIWPTALTAAVNGTTRGRRRSQASRPMHGGCTTCMVTCSSG
jgi:Sulfatase-modifying factor enzyme 1